MLVALGVIAVAALTLVRLDAFALRSAADLDERTLAQIIVQNEAVMVMTDPGPPTIGTGRMMVENAGRQFAVERRVAPTADANLLRIDIIARPTRGRGQAALTIIRPAR
jgi:general secretion pathway protein I